MVAKQSTPIQVQNISNVIAITPAPGGSHSLALRSDNIVMAWGYNAGGGIHLLFLKQDGTVWS